MAMRSANTLKQPNPKTRPNKLWLLAALFFVFDIVSPSGKATLGLLLILAMIYFEHRKNLATAAEKALWEIVDRSTRQHARKLLIRINQLRISDEYGNEDASKAAEHIRYFISKVIFRDLKIKGYGPDRFAANAQTMTLIFKRVMDIVVEEASEEAELSLEGVKTGIDYELFCKRVLEAANWSVVTTPVTGDQGADLIASRKGLRAVIQCKFYSNPVGNKAVQEAFAAKTFQNADVAIVVSNAAFTASAKQLAATNGVLLLHHNELQALDDMIERLAA